VRRWGWDVEDKALTSPDAGEPQPEGVWQLPEGLAGPRSDDDASDFSVF